jgi:hypothetical protein
LCVACEQVSDDKLYELQERYIQAAEDFNAKSEIIRGEMMIRRVRAYNLHLLALRDYARRGSTLDKLTSDLLTRTKPECDESSGDEEEVRACPSTNVEPIAQSQPMEMIKPQAEEEPQDDEHVFNAASDLDADADSEESTMAVILGFRYTGKMFKICWTSRRMS